MPVMTDKGPFWHTHKHIIGSGGGTALSFTGSTTIAQNAGNPDNIITLVVLNNPSVNPYDGFAEVTDADNKFALSGDEITVTTTTNGSFVGVWKATSSGGNPDLTLTLTVTVADQTAPTVSSFSPLDNATGVAITATLTATMSETVTLGASGTIYLKKTSDNTTIDSWDVATDGGSGAGQVEVLTNTALTLHLSASLANSIEYYVVWDAGVVKDASNNPVAALSSTTTWSFTTVAAGPDYTDIDAIASTTGAYWDVANAGSRWQDAGKTVPAVNGDPCRVLEDLSGNGHDFIAPDDASRPSVVVSGSVGYLDFTAASTHKMSTASFQLTKTTEGEWFAGAAVRMDTVTGVQGILMSDHSTNGGTKRVAQFLRLNGAEMDAIAFTSDGTGAASDTEGTTIQTATFYKMTGEAAYNAGSETVEAFLANVGNGSASIASLNAGASQELTLFANVSADGPIYANYADGRFYRGCLFPKALSAGQKTTVDTYLGGNGP